MAAWWEDDNKAAPARGVWNGVAISIVVWALIIAVIFFGFHV